MNLLVKDSRLFSHEGYEIKPNDEGIAVVEVEGVNKRFVVAKLINYLAKGNELKPGRVIEKIGTVKNKTYKPKYNKWVKKGNRGHHRRIPVIAIDAAGVEQRFISATEAANKLGVLRGNITRSLAKPTRKAGGYKFKYADKAVI